MCATLQPYVCDPATVCVLEGGAHRLRRAEPGGEGGTRIGLGLGVRVGLGSRLRLGFGLGLGLGLGLRVRVSVRVGG